jgi:hypothetical protein
LPTREDDRATSIVIWTVVVIIAVGLYGSVAYTLIGDGRDTITSIAEEAGRCGTLEECDKAVAQIYRFYQNEMDTGPTMMNWCLGALELSRVEPAPRQNRGLLGRVAFWSVCPRWLYEDGWRQMARENAFISDPRN